MPAIHTDNLPASDPYFILAVVDTLSYAENARFEERELSRESAEILDAICVEVSEIVPDFEGDLGDFAADLDELI